MGDDTPQATYQRLVCDIFSSKACLAGHLPMETGTKETVSDTPTSTWLIFVWFGVETSEMVRLAI